MIISHAGWEREYINNTLPMFKSSSKGDYRDDMNLCSYIQWLNDKLAPNLPLQSVLVSLIVLTITKFYLNDYQQVIL